MGACAPDADTVLLEVVRAMMAVSVRAASAVPGGIPPVQLRALTALQGLQPANLADLGAALGMSPSSTSRLCDRLVTRGLVHRKVSPHIRREVSLNVSAQGSRLLAEYDGHRLDALSAALANLAPQRRPEVVAALRDFVGAVEATGPRVRS